MLSRKPLGMVEQLSVDEPTIDDVPLVSMRSKSSSLKRSGAMTPTQRNSFRRMREKMKDKQMSLPDDRRSRSGSPAAAHSDLENSMKYSDQGRRWTTDLSTTSGSYDVEMASRGHSSSSHSSGRAGDSESESELAASIQARSNGRSSLPMIVVDKPLSARLAARAARQSASFDFDDREPSNESEKKEVEDELPKIEHKWKRKNASRIGRRQQESDPILTKFEAKVTDLTSTSLDFQKGERDLSPVVKDTEMVQKKSEEEPQIGYEQTESSIPPSQPIPVIETSVSATAELPHSISSDAAVFKPSIVEADKKDDEEEDRIGAFPRRSIQADDSKIKKMREKARLSARRARQEGMSRAVREQEHEELEQAPSTVLGGEGAVNNQSETIAQEQSLPSESEMQQAPQFQTEPIESKSSLPSEAPAEKPAEEQAETFAEEPAKEEPVKEAVETPVEEPAKETVIEEPAKETPVEEPVKEAVETPVEEPVKEAVETPVEEPVEEPAEEPVKEPDDIPPPLPPRDTGETKNKNEEVKVEQAAPPSPLPEETQSKEEEVKALPDSGTAQEDKTETQEEEQPQDVHNEPASADTAISPAVSDQPEVTGEQDNFETPLGTSFRRRNVTRSRVKRPPPRWSISSDTSPSHNAESAEAPSTKSSDIPEETKKEDEVQRLSERSSIQADDVELQKKREKARLAARRMRGGKYYAPSSQEDSQSIPAEPSREETHSPVRTDSLAESKTERSGSITSSRRLFSIQPNKPPPRLPRKPDTDAKPAAESSQMDDGDSPRSGRFRRRNATRSERRGSSRRHVPPSPEHAEEDSSQAATIQSQGDEKLV